ncbi:hypothetical protein SK128_016117, partial [Halocaridina rubra]
TPPTGPEVPGTRVSGLIVIIITLVGAALLVLNVALVACFIKRRARKRMTGGCKRKQTDETRKERRIKGILRSSSASSSSVLSRSLQPPEVACMCMFRFSAPDGSRTRHIKGSGGQSGSPESSYSLCINCRRAISRRQRRSRRLRFAPTETQERKPW